MILFLYGDDSYRLRKKLKEITDKFTRDHDKSGLNLTRFDGAKLDPAAFQQSIGAAPFMAKRRMVVLENFLSGNKKKNSVETQNFASLQNTSDDVILVIAENSSVKDLSKNPLFKILGENKYNYIFEPLKGIELERWIKNEALSRGIGFSPEMLGIFTAQIGNDLWRAASELDKIAAYIGSKKTGKLGVADFNKLISSKTEQNIFGLIDAIGNRDKKTALKKLSDEIRAGSNELYILTMLLGQFELLISVKDLYDSGERDKSAIAAKLDVHPFKVQKALAVIKKFSTEELKKIFGSLIQIDRQIKTGYGKPELLLDLFVAKL
ncbi:MAG: DNA polymerase III subunit delta [Patescibacteria group bacterium]